MSAQLALAEATDAPALLRMERGPAAHARLATDNIEFSVYYELAAVEPVWRSLQQDGGCTAFQTFQWLSAWQRHVGSRIGATPCIVLARDESGAPLFIFPLALRTSGFVCELTWLGSDLCDYNAPIFAKSALDRLPSMDFAAVWRKIAELLQSQPRTRHDLVRLEKMPPTIAGRANPLLALPVTLNPSGSYVTSLFGTWDEFYKARRSSSTRRRDRSKRNHLAEAGEVKFVTREGRAAALETFDVLVAQKTKIFARQGIRSVFTRPGYLDFYRELAGAGDPVHISKLQVGDETAAANLGLVFGGRYYHVLASYTDGDLSHWGPGAAHLNDLLAYAIERKLEAFDFTIGDERYKRDWCDEVQPLYDHLAIATWRGGLAAGPVLIGHRLKRIIKQTPILWAAATKFRLLAARLRQRGPAGPESESQ